MGFEMKSLGNQARTLSSKSMASFQPKLRSKPVTMQALEARRATEIAKLTKFADRRYAMGYRKIGGEYRRQIALLERPLESLSDEELRLCFGLNGIQYVAR